MSHTPINDLITARIVNALPDALVQVEGAGGHFTIAVTSSAFAGKTLLNKQRLVYTAIADLMSGANAPVHAVDKLITQTPA